jgi:hypothetical protein
MPESSFNSASDASLAPNSPATNTRSHKRSVSSPIPVLESPKKKRRAKAELSDIAIWSNTDDKIISECLSYLIVRATYHFTRGIDITLEIISLQAL